MPHDVTRTRYIVRTVDDAGTPALTAFVAGIDAIPALRLVDTIGPRGRPHTAVIETDAITADQLQAAFRTSNQLMIEPDQPLSLSD